MVKNKLLKKDVKYNPDNQYTRQSRQSKQGKQRNLINLSKDSSINLSTNKPELKRYFMLGIILAILIILILGFYIIYTSTTMFKHSRLTNVDVALKWVHQSQFAGNYVAQDKGFYAIHGINASLIAYNFKDSPIDLVASGKVEFGVAGADEIFLARASGVPVKAVAVIYRINPVCAYALKSSGINSPKDFIGKTIGIEKGINVEYNYIAMMDRLGIDRSKLTELAIGYESKELLNGSVDVSTGYVINEPYYVMSQGLDVVIFMVEDYGVNIYADVLFTTDLLIETNPELVNNFVQATIDGWMYALEHEDETVDVVMRYAVNADLDHEKYALKTSLPLVNTGMVPIGVMTEEDWNNVEQIVSMQKQNVTNISVTDCYTTQFMDTRDVWHDI